jgi:hypothetical protein
VCYKLIQHFSGLRSVDRELVFSPNCSEVYNGELCDKALSKVAGPFVTIAGRFNLDP